MILLDAQFTKNNYIGEVFWSKEMFCFLVDKIVLNLLILATIIVQTEQR